MTQHTKKINLFFVYIICLFTSTLFFCFFGFNSPIYTFNTDVDYQWYMTVGNALTKGKIPYRDIFEHKGPLVYFLTAFCCLFPSPNIVMLIIEIFSMSLFFFFTYKICTKRLNPMLSFIIIPMLAFAIFSSWSRITHGSTVEEFTLPIYTYFLSCWIEFIFEKRDWSFLRSLFIGMCLAFIFWSKFSILSFVIAPMLIWLIINIKTKKYKTLIGNLFYMIIGFIIITCPIILFFLINHAFSDLFNVYFIFNLTVYNDFSILSRINLITANMSNFFCIGPVLLFLFFWTIGYLIFNLNEKNLLILISFSITFIMLIFIGRIGTYYYSILIPYTVLGSINLIQIAFSKFQKKYTRYSKFYYTLFIFFCFAITIPFSNLPYEADRPREDHAPLVFADIINNYEKANNKEATLFCYKTPDYGIYNAAGIIPDKKYFVMNGIDESPNSMIHNAHKNYITEQSADFVVARFGDWCQEYDFLSQYYQPYTNNINTSTYHYYHVVFTDDLILLIKK